MRGIVMILMVLLRMLPSIVLGQIPTLLVWDQAEGSPGFPYPPATLPFANRQAPR
jgi:hypothetical protein